MLYKRRVFKFNLPLNPVWEVPAVFKPMRLLSNVYENIMLSLKTEVIRGWLVLNGLCDSVRRSFF